MLARNADGYPDAYLYGDSDNLDTNAVLHAHGDADNYTHGNP